VSSRELEGQVALVTGGGRGIGRGIALELASAGARVAVAARTREQVEGVAAEIDGLAIAADVSDRAAVERMVGEVERELGPIDLLVNNAGIAVWEETAWEMEPDDWWRVFEVNVLGVYLCCHAFAPRMIERGGGRIVNVASGAAYLPARSGGSTAYGASKAAVHRFSELLAPTLREQNVFVFSISPGLVKTQMTSGFADDAPWTPPECAPALVRALVSGEFDALAGRYLHAEHDPPAELRERIAQIEADDLNAIRLRR
jgi:3-oxoacyl-[acyl-carrier protein] reductase